MVLLRILFIYPNILRYPFVPIGLSSLIATLRDEGHECSLFDATFIDDEDLISELIKNIEDSTYDLLAVTCSSSDWNFVKILLDALEKGLQRHILTVIGGPHPTAVPDEVILSPFIDICVVGEGELVMKELLQRLERSEDIRNIKNCWIKISGDIFKNGLRPLIQDLDLLPYPAWEIFDVRHLARDANDSNKVRSGRIGLESTRGCPYSCTYCMNSHLRNIYKDVEGRFYREKSAQRVIEEAILAKEKLCVDYIQFVDDNFVGSTKRLEELSMRVPEEVGLPLSVQASADKINEKTIKLLAEMGVVRIEIGIETGNETYRREILNKQVSDEQIVRAFNLTKEYGIDTMAYYMIGLPMEKRHFIDQTIKFNEWIKPDTCFVSTFFPFPGTPLYDAVMAKGLVENYDFLPDFYHNSILKFDDLASDEFESLRKQFSNVVLFRGPFQQRDLKKVINGMKI